MSLFGKKIYFIHRRDQLRSQTKQKKRAFASVSGVFAAGDDKNTPLRRMATEVDDGTAAVISAGQNIENLKK